MAREKIAFCMFLNPGQAVEYKRRHDEIWPELTQLLKTAGISDYSIYLDEQRHILFATQFREQGQNGLDLAQQPVMQRWWAHMSDLMQSNPDGSPVVERLPCVFHMD